MAMFVPTAIDPAIRETKLDSATFQKYVKSCLSSIIVLGQNRQVVKKADLYKLMYAGGPSQYYKTTRLIVNQANHDLHKYMGMRLFELEDSKGYLLVNATSDLAQYRPDDSDTCVETAVIFLALMEIFTSSDESSTEEQIREVFKHLQLEEDIMKKHFDMLQKKLYIVPCKNSAYQQEEKLYKWGPRAIAEVNPDKFMEAFLDLAQEGEEKDWPDQKRRIDVLKAVKNR